MKLLRYLSPVTTFSLCTLASLASITTATAQIIPDSSLGAESSVVNPDVINGIPSDRIDGGATRGSSLFHSFQEFNIGEGRGAYFSNPANITNILTRVTGGNPSNILGRLGVLGNANLFLLNPKGIYFGPNASLDLGGSFFGTTADSFIFNDNFEFSATNPQAVPLLSVNIPIGLRFRDNPGSITNQSIFRDVNNNLVGLQVQPGNSLALVGGNINLSDGGRLTASGGSIELGGLATAGTVGLNVTGNSFKLNFPTNILLSDITISNARVQNVVFTGTTGTGGNINITTRNLSLLNGGLINASTYGIGNAGRVVINATGNISASGEDNEGFGSGILSEVAQNAEGNAGGIQINTKDLSLIDGGQISASTRGKGNAASVIINATGNIFASGEDKLGFTSGIFSFVDSSGLGNGGGIQINTKDLSLTNGGIISASTLGKGNAGSVLINASGNISAFGESKDGFNSGIFSQVFENALGDAGGIQINTKDLSLTDGAQVSASTFGEGNAGSVIINATGNVSASGENKYGNNSGIFSEVGRNAEGNAEGNSGGIQINTKDLSLTNSGLISASTFGKGNAGSVIINATGNVSASGESQNGFFSGIFSEVGSSGIFSEVGRNAEGNSGGIKINARSLSLSNRAILSANSEGTGAAGNIEVTIAKDIRLDNQALIIATTTGGQGNIFLYSRDLILRRDSNIGAVAEGIGGNIAITTGNLVALENSDILANATLSRGGNVLIDADSIFGTEFRDRLTPESDIVATGSVRLFTLNTQEVGQVLPELPQNPTDPGHQIAQNPCQKGSGSSFVFIGRGGLPSSPNDGFSNNETRVDLVEPVASSSNSQAATTNQPVIVSNTNKRIIPAQGWIFNSKGEVVLTAYDPTATSTAQRNSKPTAACPAF